MNERERITADALRKLEDHAKSVGICPVVFATIREEFEQVCRERDLLALIR